MVYQGHKAGANEMPRSQKSNGHGESRWKKGRQSSVHVCRVGFQLDCFALLTTSEKIYDFHYNFSTTGPWWKQCNLIAHLCLVEIHLIASVL